MELTISEIEAVLRRPLIDSERTALPVLTEEALALVEGYMGADYSVDPPRVVHTVVRRIVVRAMSANPALDGVASLSETNGPFNQSTTYVNNGSPLYISKTEKTMLESVRSSFGVLTLGNY